jgi:putative ABC transport system permease protein
MFQHYLKASLNTFKRFSIQLSLAMFSLVIGLTGAAVLLLYAYQEFSFNDSIPNAEKTYTLEIERTGRVGERLHGSTMSRDILEAFTLDFQEIETKTSFMRYPEIRQGLVKGENKISRVGVAADEGFFSIFKLPLVLGDADNLFTRPDAIVLSQSTATTLFGDTNPIGQTLSTTGDPKRPLTITGVIKDLPNNINLKGDYFYRLKPIAADAKPNWRFGSFQYYFTLKGGVTPDQISTALNQFIEQTIPADIQEQMSLELNIVSLEDLYFHGANLNPQFLRGNYSLVMSFIAVAGFLILISSFNFTNLMLAVHTARRKELALRKVAGASQSQLIMHITSEIFFLVSFAIITSFLAAQALLPIFNQVFIVALEQNVMDNPKLVFGYGAILVAVVILSSLSPSRMVGNIRPAAVLSGSAAHEKKSKIISSLFLIFQFAFAICLIPIILVVSQQVNHAEQTDVGFRKEGILLLSGIQAPDIRPNFVSLENEIRALPYVKLTTTSGPVPGDYFPLEFPVKRLDLPDTTKGTVVNIGIIGEDFFQTYEVPAVAGRLFSREVYKDVLMHSFEKGWEKEANVIINESAVKAFGYVSNEDAIGKLVKGPLGPKFDATIIGVVPDFNFVSLKKKIPPELYINYIASRYKMSISYETDDFQGMISNLEDIWKKIGATSPLDYTLATENWNKAYADDRLAANLFTVFAMIGVLISLAGIYSVMLFETSKQLHEVAIRKVMGGSIKDIMKLLMLKSSIPVVIACFIALPLAWYGLSEWLNGYVDRIALDPLVFIGSGLAMLVISWITVGSHAYKVASAKPAEALRSQ